MGERASGADAIPGIYNYCDEWCERCPFTSRCLAFPFREPERDEDPADDELDPILFTRFVDKMLYRFTQLAERDGVDLSDIGEDIAGDDPVPDEETEPLRKPDDELTRAAFAYVEAVHRWYEKVLDTVEEEGLLPEDGRQASEDEQDPAQEATSMVLRYQHFIYRKITRAVIRRHLDRTGERADTARDADGSAKIALIVMDRSEEALHRLVAEEVLCADDLAAPIERLRVLRRKTEAAFPRARDFVRPGFDEDEARGRVPSRG